MLCVFPPSATQKIEEGDWAAAFFAYQFMSIFFVMISAAFCYLQPLAIGATLLLCMMSSCLFVCGGRGGGGGGQCYLVCDEGVGGDWVDVSAGGGIADIKAFLNGVNLSQFINMRLLVSKILGICFSIAAGLPVGRKGPVIQIGSIVAAIVSQGKNKAFGLDISWTKFDDFRNDHTKRDFVTYGTAAGVAAGFRSPIGMLDMLVIDHGSMIMSTTQEATLLTLCLML